MKTSNYGASPMKELKIIYSKEGTIFGRHLPVRIVLALLHTCANGSHAYIDAHYSVNVSVKKAIRKRGMKSLSRSLPD